MEAEIYLDNNATTRPSAEVRQAMLQALDEGFGNPSSDHARGQHARDAIHKARTRVACLIGADPAGVIFTGSATEANAIILRSAVESTDRSSRIITTPVEHSSVLRTCDYLAGRGASIGYPGREKFAKLTQQEERRGLYEDTLRIGRRDGWNFVLEEKQVRLRGHQVVRRSAGV